MKNFIKSIIIIIILILLYLKRPLVIYSIIEGFDLWKSNIFPSIFPIMILSDFILSSNLILIISNVTGPLFAKCFKVSKYAAYIFIMSFFSGCPTNAKYIKDLLTQGVITNEEASKILSMSLLYNPILIFTITSYLEFKDSVLLILVNLLANIVIGLINRNYNCNLINKEIDIKGFNLVDSIGNAINVLLLILGSLITFISINTLLPYHHPLITGILEITNGIEMIEHYNISYKYKLIFSSILMGFGGFSILFQIKSIFKDTLIDYSLYYKSRIIHILLMIIFGYVILN